MSDQIPTPRTDAVCQDDFMVNHEAKPSEIYVPSEFARDLERELNKWKNWHEQTRLGGQALAAERDNLERRIAFRDEALDKLLHELAVLKRGEFICAKCGLRKDGEPGKGEF